MDGWQPGGTDQLFWGCPILWVVEGCSWRLGTVVAVASSERAYSPQRGYLCLASLSTILELNLASSLWIVLSIDDRNHARFSTAQK